MIACDTPDFALISQVKRYTWRMQKTLSSLGLVAIAGLSLSALPQQVDAEPVHFTYLWHMEQPIYWPDRRGDGPWRYERLWQSLQQKNAGAEHPENNIFEIFSKPDRVAAYQYRPRETVSSISYLPEAGAQVSYSGGLIANLQSLAEAGGQLGYSSDPFADYRVARGWQTAGGVGVPRLDVVRFAFHHPLLPLCDDELIRKELALYHEVYAQAWGSGAPMSTGFFPSEMAFSTRLVPLLQDAGIEWSFVSAEKISRAFEDFPVQLGSGGINTDPPNRADQLNGTAGDYVRTSISRGVTPAEAAPQGLTPQRVRYVDPETGEISEIIAVPCSQSLGWEDGYGPMGVSRLDALAPSNDAQRPMLIVLAHDGDNAWGGGYSYYNEAVPNFVGAASGAGYVPTVVERYLADHPVPADAVVHVEDGAWVNADGDFGSPQFVNWVEPLRDGSGVLDPKNGWSVDVRAWALITAGTNYAKTAEQIQMDQGMALRIDHVLNPSAFSTRAERAWHFLLGGVNSGYVYYGSSLDLVAKPGVAVNEAVSEALPVLGSGADATGPTVWMPQRFPWNPGGVNFGSPYGYQQFVDDGDFTVWTLVHDVAGLQSVTLKYRVDLDGEKPMNSVENGTYAGGAGVGEWISVPMTIRAFPDSPPAGHAPANLVEPATDIASHAWADIEGVREALLDYYVEAIDTQGNVTRSPIQHVWVGDGEGSNGGGDAVVVEPEQLIAGETSTITYDASGRPLDGASQVYLHYGFNGWSVPIVPDPAMSFDSGEGVWRITVPLIASATQLNLVFNDGQGNWDNNGGQDWNYAVSGGEPTDEFVIDGMLDDRAELVATGPSGRRIWASVEGTTLYVATEPAGAGDDVFLLIAGDAPGAMRSAMWGKAGQVASWDAFIGNENDNGYHGWFNSAGSGAPGAAHQSASGSVLEGTIDLEQLLGSVPERIAIASVAYATPDGGALRASRQVPGSNDGDGNLDADEWVEVEICSIDVNGTCCAGDVTSDGAVDLSDLNLVLANFGQATAEGDTNGDGVVDLQDLNLVLAQFGAGC